jgi:putative transposase
MEALRTERFFVPMRKPRPDFPGLAFHITARTQGHEPWFTEDIRGAIARHIDEGLATSDAILIARTVMPNHFHIVLRQGTRPLGWVMQPIMRRIALRVQRRHDVEGHIFERRYRSKVCNSADYLRCAIVYTNLNPERAGLCDDGCDYPWSTASQYILGRDGCVSGIQIKNALMLFTNDKHATLDDARACYIRYSKWRREKDRHEAEDKIYMVPEPAALAGDVYFAESYCTLPQRGLLQLTDLRDKAIEILREIDPSLDINVLRRRYLPRAVAQQRYQLMAALVQREYRGKAIATFFRVSESTVSSVAVRVRYGALDNLNSATRSVSLPPRQSG